MKQLLMNFAIVAIVIMAAVLNISPAHAQWRAGVTTGGAWNHYSINKHYMDDWDYEGKWGLTIGATGQYNFYDWLAVRADFNWTQKNHRQYRHLLNSVDYDTRNDYLQLPVMASFSFGSKQVRGFLNLGAYGGYWCSSRNRGTYYDAAIDATYNIDESVEFIDERDQRWDAGLVGGIGIEYVFAKHWAAQVEARCYYSTTSIQKDYMQIKDPKYNTTIGLQAAICYIF
jgi:hypothetical protein